MTDTPRHRFEPGWIGWRTYDARGRRVRVRKAFLGIDRNAFHFRAINRWINARVQDRSYQHASPYAKRRAEFNFALWFVVPMLAYIGLLVLAPANVIPVMIARFALFVVLVCAFLLLLFFIHHNEPRRQIDAMLRDRACPSCLHNMKGASKEADGCTLCPECDAAWRLPDGEN